MQPKISYLDYPTADLFICMLPLTRSYLKYPPPLKKKKGYPEYDTAASGNEIPTVELLEVWSTLQWWSSWKYGVLSSGGVLGSMEYSPVVELLGVWSTLQWWSSWEYGVLSSGGALGSMEYSPVVELLGVWSTLQWWSSWEYGVLSSGGALGSMEYSPVVELLGVWSTLQWWSSWEYGVLSSGGALREYGVLFVAISLTLLGSYLYVK